jgi:hypothetical protein
MSEIADLAFSAFGVVFFRPHRYCVLPETGCLFSSPSSGVTGLVGNLDDA